MKTGFTLIEMLVVVLIIAILASIAFPQYQQAVTKARYIKLMPLVKAFKNAEEEYWYMHRDYTRSFEDLGFSVKGFTQSNYSCAGDTTSTSGTCYSLKSADRKYELRTDAVGKRSGMAVYGILKEGGKQRMLYLMYLDHSSAPGRTDCRSYYSGRWRNICMSLSGNTNCPYSSGNKQYVCKFTEK